ncbi:TIGR03752 family integrating conjugative element protein [Vibrio sp. 10N.261.46.A3]|uniref:TIGR03752 family integrating conjugative element protein n=1 Tax=Vibrio sp. 10N.261.46.A3 TaxID=3229658 RepID=UPI00355106A4
MVKGNKLLPMLVGTALLSVIAISFTGSPEEEKDVEATPEASTDTSETVVIDAVGQTLIGDTFEDGSGDTLRTLTATIKHRNEEIEALKAAHQKEQEKTATALKQQQESTEKIAFMLSTVTEEMSRLQARVKAGAQELKDKQAPIHQGNDHVESDWQAHCDPELTALGLGECSTVQTEHSDTTTPNTRPEAYLWIDPLDARYDEEGALIRPASSSSSQDKSEWKDEHGEDTLSSTPLFSLHPGAVLSDAVSMTALMGRVPMDGQVTDPYPFSMIIGAENLLANGQTLPDVQGAIVTGTVTGDWSLSCVRGAVETLTFILADGQMVNYPDQEEAVDGEFDGSTIKTHDLGFLADVNGNPCLTGERISNAPQYLTTKGLLDAATAAANAVAVSQQTVSVDGSTTTSSVTGNAAKNATAEAAAASAQTVSDFIQSRMGMSFDIVYVPPGVKAAIHLRTPITLSLPETPKRVRYPTSSIGGAYALP